MASTDTPLEIRTVSFDSRVYSLEAVKKALYKFSDRFSSRIALSQDERQIQVELTPSKAFREDTWAESLEQLHTEVLDQDLRETIFRETEAVRNLILAQAFSKTSLLDS